MTILLLYLGQVLARYGLQKLFGPEVVGATSDRSYMYPDLPCNMVALSLSLSLACTQTYSLKEVHDIYFSR